MVPLTGCQNSEGVLLLLFILPKPLLLPVHALVVAALQV